MHNHLWRPVAIIWLSLAAIVLASSCSLFRGDPLDPTATSMAPPPSLDTDIAYGPALGCPQPPHDGCGGSQTLDIYRATENTDDFASGPGHPVAVWLHGGGFTGGDKAGSISKYFSGLLNQGWDIVAVNYRLATPDSNHFPTALADVKRAVRWIKANAVVQRWDAANVAAIGHSAGGNLAGMLAVTADRPEFEDPALPPELAAVDSSVASAVMLTPVSDMRSFRDIEAFTEAADAYLGCTGACDLQLAAASVHTHVSASSAPVLAIFGADDGFAPPQQAELLRTAFNDAGIPDRLSVIVTDDGPDHFRGHVPDMRRRIDQVSEWLDSHMVSGS